MDRRSAAAGWTARAPRRDRPGIGVDLAVAYLQRALSRPRDGVVEPDSRLIIVYDNRIKKRLGQELHRVATLAVQRLQHR